MCDFGANPVYINFAKLNDFISFLEKTMGNFHRLHKKM